MNNWYLHCQPEEEQRKGERKERRNVGKEGEREGGKEERRTWGVKAVLSPSPSLLLLLLPLLLLLLLLLLQRSQHAFKI